MLLFRLIIAVSVTLINCLRINICFCLIWNRNKNIFFIIRLKCVIHRGILLWRPYFLYNLILIGRYPLELLLIFILILLKVLALKFLCLLIFWNFFESSVQILYLFEYSTIIIYFGILISFYLFSLREKLLIILRGH